MKCTSDEAQRKVCIHARHFVGGSDLCKGNGCMAWVWLDNYGTSTSLGKCGKLLKSNLYGGGYN